MSMKQLFIQLMVGILFTLAACRNEVIPEETGNKIALSFNLYQAELTKADAASSIISEGTMLRAYAYTKDAATTGKPVGFGDYVVNSTGVANAANGGGLTLYRGDYDIYLVSYNDKNYVPEAGNDNLLHVSNGKDFMYSALKGITVQPTSGGADMMSVDLPEPFTRLCSEVIVKVKANTKQPVGVERLWVNSVKMSKLSGDLSYQMGMTDWTINNSLEYTGSKTFEKETFTNNSKTEVVESTTARVSAPIVVLPLKGIAPLEFDLDLEIQFLKSGTGSVTKSFHYYPSVYKSFLPGMTYEFEFTLTFFGDLEPTDLSLAILEYTTVKFSTDDVGQ